MNQHHFSAPSKALNQNKFPKFDLQLAADQVLKSEANEIAIPPPHETPQYATHESLTAEIIEATPHIHTEFSDPFETTSPVLPVANGHVDEY